MSQVLTAFIEKSRVPEREQLETAVRALGFDLTVDKFYKPFDCSGFLPCVLRGDQSGFEIDFDSAAELLVRYPHLKQEVGTRESAVSFRWGSDMSECACSLIVAAALAMDFGAVIYYRDGGVLYTTERVLKEAQSALNQSR